MKIIFLFITSLCLLLSSCGSTEENVPTGGNEGGSGNDGTVEAAMKALWEETSYRELSVKRTKALDQMQLYANQCQNTDFKSYLVSTDRVQVSNYEKGYGILDFYNKAFDRVLADIKSTTVEDGSVVVWQIYNMGYIVKTPAGKTFSIDIYHKRGPELAKHLDFALITHKHEDHYTQAFVDEMTKEGKPVYSNFIANDYKISGTKTFNPLTVSDISIVANIVDHGMANPANFVVSYQIDCGAKSGNTVIFHIGDCGNVAQLNPTKAVDIFIPHVAVSLDMKRAITEKVKPEMALMSHVLSMDYPISGSYRWPYTTGINECHKYDVAFLPVWGERIDYKK